MYRFYPIAVIFIVSHNVVVSEDPIGQLKILWIFWLCVGGMIIFHVAVVLPVLFVAIIRANPYKYFLGCFHAMFTAFVFNDRLVYSSNSKLFLKLVFICVDIQVITIVKLH